MESTQNAIKKRVVCRVFLVLSHHQIHLCTFHLFVSSNYSDTICQACVKAGMDIQLLLTVCKLGIQSCIQQIFGIYMLLFIYILFIYLALFYRHLWRELHETNTYSFINCFSVCLSPVFLITFTRQNKIVSDYCLCTDIVTISFHPQLLTAVNLSNFIKI